jgi:serine/threonine protein kinase
MVIPNSKNIFFFFTSNRILAHFVSSTSFANHITVVIRNIKDIAKLRGSEDLWEVSKLHNRESSFPAVFTITCFDLPWIMRRKWIHVQELILSQDLYNMQSLPPTTIWEWCKLNSKRQDFLDAVPSSLIDLVDKCLTVNPRLRISADDALKHEFFAPCNESLRRQKLLRQGHSLDSRTKTPSHGQSIARPIKISQRQPWSALWTVCPLDSIWFRLTIYPYLFDRIFAYSTACKTVNVVPLEACPFYPL